MHKPMPNHKLFIDTGGTFTDAIAIMPYGDLQRKKILSSGRLRGQILNWIDEDHLQIEENWGSENDIFHDFWFSTLDKSIEKVRVLSYTIQTNILTLASPIKAEKRINKSAFEIYTNEEAPVVAARLLTQTPLSSKFPPTEVRLGTTKGTNALLEHKGARNVLFITKGFADLLEIGTQARPDIFSLNIKKRKSLVDKIIEIDERIDSKGAILKPLDCIIYKKQIEELKAAGFESFSIVFMNAYKNNVNELRFKELLVESGFKYISVSSELSPLIKILERAETTTVNAYLSPIIENYLENITENTEADLRVMNSAGGLMQTENYEAKDSLLSGPAGGVVGAAYIGQLIDQEKLITFDMGGTSTDVSRFYKNFDYRYELEIGSAHIYSPAISIETVAAGGGSICSFDGYKLTVGPESAGANPGPACYGAGGPLTITDINLLLGRIDETKFGIPVDKKAAQKQLDILLQEIQEKRNQSVDRKEVLTGFLAIANEIMASAIKKISTSKGFDPAEYSLLGFGGAGGMHSCAIADLLQIKKIIIPLDAGLLSAFGIGNAALERFAEKQILKPFEVINPQLNEEFQFLSDELKVQFDENKGKLVEDRMLFLRFKGQDSTLSITWNSSKDNILSKFKEEYIKLYGHWVDHREIELESIRIKISQKAEKALLQKKEKASFEKPIPKRIIQSSEDPDAFQIAVFSREDLGFGHKINGPALVSDDKSTTVIDAGWIAEVDAFNNLILSKDKAAQKQNKNEHNQETALELFTNRFMAIAENMGAILQRTALSVNIKERLDFSCALLDADGYLVANAPHIPVHLGSLGVCVRSVLEHFDFKPGDTIVTNHPLYGGSHLPDVSLITAVFDKNNKRIGFVVNRAHHAEIGGMTPGSMPTNATNLEQEGIVISPFYLVKEGRVDWEGMRSIFDSGKYPSRLINENMADLNAALAANKNGEQALLNLVEEYTSATVQKYMQNLKSYAHKKIQDVLLKLPNGKVKAIEYLDDDTPLAVTIDVQDASISFDFTGSGAVHPSNLNATPAIVSSVIIYVLRLLLDEPIPLNDGLMEPVKINIPEGLLNPPFNQEADKCPAVVGGNIEVSQRLTDTILKAFEKAACSQGTMNNVLFGNVKFGYYETIAGGSGAGENFAGTSGVHQHMTNTRITDPEILEHRYPVRLDRFAIRKNSGGNGEYSGGNGVIRSFTFLEKVELSLLSQHRKYAPYGLYGGESGKLGKQYVIRANGKKIGLNGMSHCVLHKNDQFSIETPGGGGFGKTKSS
ncbi:MAG: hydantoinase B/oxoprolinase family protein [Bacteroidales bacterium]|nr:hydantoinase B/oxoprolinase family protein [Bacteroidales bacterium]